MNGVSLVFILTTCCVIGMISMAVKHHKGVLSILVFCLAGSGILAYQGFFLNTNYFPPPFLLILLMSTLLFGASYKLVKDTEVRFEWLIAIHIIRIPVEIILFQLFKQGLIPKLMTFEGWNWDILSGISAVTILWLYRSNRLSTRLFYWWNVGALGLLGIIVSSAILSAPTPVQRFAFEQPNRAVLQYPFVWLPAVIVPIVFLSHIILIKKYKKYIFVK